MDKTAAPPTQLRVKTSFSIEHILSKPEKSIVLHAKDSENRFNESFGEIVDNFSYIGSSSAASEQKRRSCENLVNNNQRSDHSNDGDTPDSSCCVDDTADTFSDLASEESCELIWC